MTSSRDEPQAAGRSGGAVADLRASIDRWQGWGDRARAAEASAPVTLVEGHDPRDVVTVRVDERWRLVAIRLRNTWRDLVDPAELGSAVVEAVADAVHERLRPAIEVIGDVEELPGADIEAALAADDAELVVELATLPGFGPPGNATLSIDVVEAQLADFDRLLVQYEATPPPMTVVGRSRRQEVEVELGLVGLPVRVTCRLEWVRATSVDRLTSALAEAFVDAYAAADDQPASAPFPGAA